ncbi:MAG TPA: hypothetical protein VL961_04010 [Acidimicrobiales bacterium]|nr:hypothetical protein [Acidimicrobiales bacterium]
MHAYLLVGASGNGAFAAARGFAATLLCPDGGCGHCATCARVQTESHPDFHVIRRSGAALTVADVRRVVALAQRRPLEAPRQVVVLTDVHLSGAVAPALLKTLEEPPGQSVFVLLADDIPPELSTVASRCVRVPFPPVPRQAVLEWLSARGIAEDLAAVVADTCGGNPERARVMVEDPEVAERAALWASVPDRLTGSGDAAVALARQLVESTDRAVEPLRAEHARRIEAMTAEAKEFGERGLPGRKEITDRLSREERRWRADALRAGLGALARSYVARGAAAAAGEDPGGRTARAAVEAVGLITEAAVALTRNASEPLLLQALLVRLGALFS